MKISKSLPNLYFTNKLVYRFIFFIFLTSSFVNNAENKVLFLNNHNLSSNFSLNSFSKYFNSISIAENETRTICSGEPLGILFNFTDNKGITPSKFLVNIDGNESNLNNLTPSPDNKGESFELSQGDPLNDSYINRTNISQKVVYIIKPIKPNGIFSSDPNDYITLTVFVNPEPVVQNQDISTICSGEPLGISFNESNNTSVAVASYNIISINNNSLPASPGNTTEGSGFSRTVLSDDSFTNTTNALVNVIYTVVPVSAAGCEGDAFTVTVPINPEPKVDPQTATVCSDEPIGVTLINVLI